MVLALIGVAFGLAHVVSRRRDPRLLRNGVYLTAGVLFLGLGLLEIAAIRNPVAYGVLVLLLLAAVLSIPVFGIGLIANGVLMLRREGRSLGNQLSLVAGLLVLVLPVAALVITAGNGVAGLAVAAVIVLVSAYASIAFVSFAVYSVVYGRMRHAALPSAVVVHGSGLVRGGVSPLLRGRLDRGIAVYRAAVARGGTPVLVPSGGQGSDEPRPEADAMAEYLLAQGVPAADVLQESRSTTTRENIELSVGLLADGGRSGPITLVTSDYHVLRTASLARRLGVDAQVVGSRTARYYVPSAFIREFVALLVEHRWVTVIALGPFVVVALFIGFGGLSVFR